MRFTVLNPLTIFIGILLLICVVIPLLPILLLIFILFLLFGRTVSVRNQYERFRDSRFYGNMRQDRQSAKKADDPDVCDVECTVISSETVDDNKK